MFRTRTVPPNVINWYGYVDLSLYWDTWLPEEGPFDEFPAETDEEDEDSDMSLQFQRPKGPDVNYVPKNIAKSPTFILNAVIGVANKITWAMIEQKIGNRGASNKGTRKEK
ncbi:hypothetical protein Tco_1558157, partial [Tanacetum coccineum]